MSESLTSLGQRRSNEVNAIRSIYPDEFEELQPLGPTVTDRFVIHIVIQDDNSISYSIDIEFHLSLEYPEEAPDIKVSRKRKISTPEATKIQEKLIRRAINLKGTEMLYELIEDGREHLLSIARCRVSIHEQMTMRKNTVSHGLESSPTVQNEKENANIVKNIQEKIEEELAAKENILRASREKRFAQSWQHIDNKPKSILFNPPIQIFVPDRQEPIMNASTVMLGDAIFDSILPEFGVSYRGTIFEGPIVNASSGKESSASLSTVASTLDILMTRVSFESFFYKTSQGRKKIDLLCQRLHSYMPGMRQSHLFTRIFGATIVEPQNDESCVDLWVASEIICGDMTLERLIYISGAISIPRAMGYFGSILQALFEIHTVANVAHEDISASRVAVSIQTLRCTLFFPIVTRLLRDLHQAHPISASMKSLSETVRWRPPELLRGAAPLSSNRGKGLEKKGDIWNSGQLLLQMLYGINFPASFDNPMVAIEGLRSNIMPFNLPAPIVDLLVTIFTPNPVVRPMAKELLQMLAFKSQSFLLYESSIAKPHAIKALGQETVRLECPNLNLEFSNHTKSKEKASKFASANRLLSRYKTDFEEIQFVGSGAFGSVMKVRNRIDNRVYAVKRIRLDAQNVEYNRKILREVGALSRLHNDRIVRYFQAWIEDVVDSDDEDECLSDESSSICFSKSIPKNNRKVEAGCKKKLDSSSSGTVSITEDYESDNLDDGTSEYEEAHFRYGAEVIGSSIDLFSIKKDLPTDTEYSETLVISDLDHKPKTTRKSSAKQQQILYLQMEYCPNQTLRNVIDGGIEEEEAWRLFRQIVEGLHHVHSQGMIHRDLKPGNIFLDTNGDVKIGDFGLAIGDEDDLENLKTPNGSRTKLNEDSKEKAYINKSNDDKLEFNDVMTGGIGTPFYVSPEQASLGVRYNFKADIYSLGIIFLELFHPSFRTGMERAGVIKAARLSNPQLPAIFDSPKMVLHQSILKRLLDHDPENRPSCEEMLKGDMLPIKVEDEYIEDAIKNVTTPGSTHFGRLLGSLFTQPSDPLKQYTFDFNSGISTDFLGLKKLDIISQKITEVFRRYGGIEFSAPALLPKNDQILTQSEHVKLLASDGSVVQLRGDHTMPFARFLAVSGTSFHQMRRFTVGNVYRGNVAGCQPRHHIESSFDIVQESPSNSVVAYAVEMLRVTLEAITEALNSPGLPLVIRINSTPVLRALLIQCGIPAPKIDIVKSILALNCTAGWSKVKSAINSGVALQANVIEAVGKIRAMRDLAPDITLRRLLDLVRSAHATNVEEISQFFECIGVLGSFRVRTIIDPLLVVPNDHLYDGLIFQVAPEERRKGGTLAAGGCYTSLIESLRCPTVVKRPQICAFGVTLYHNRLSTLLPETVPIIGSINPEKAPIGGAIIFGAVPLVDLVGLAALLWNSQIQVAIFSKISDSDMDSDGNILSRLRSQLLIEARWRGFSVTVQMRAPNASGKASLLRVRNLERFQETEISHSELIDFVKFAHGNIQSLDLLHLTKNTTEDGSDPQSSATQQGTTSLVSISQPTVNVTLFAPYSKMKGIQRSMVTEKSMRAVAPVIAALTGSGTNKKTVEVVSLDVSRELVRRVSDTLEDPEETIKRLCESRDDRDAALKLRRTLLALRNKYPFVFNYRDGWIMMVNI